VSGNIRPSALAGTWYPAGQQELRDLVRGFLDAVPERSFPGRPLGLISPHAGYYYSGQTAAYGYRMVTGVPYDLVVLLAPMHMLSFGRFLASSASYYSTPLGKVQVDRDALKELAGKVEITFLDSDAEHSLEIQLPFLQTVLEKFIILPIMIGTVDLGAAADLAKALLPICKGRETLIVASSDMHHINDYQEVERRDSRIEDALRRYDLPALRKELRPEECSVCGKVPIMTALTLARELGSKRLEILHRTHSGEVTGELIPGQYTVGYLSAVMLP